MSLSDCEKCWDTPCTCGHEYRDYSTGQMIEWIRGIIKDRPDKNGIINGLLWGSGRPPKEDDELDGPMIKHFQD